MKKRFQTGEQGFVLPTVLALVFLVTVLGFAAAHMVESQTQMGLRYTGREQALHFAEAGLHKYLWHLNKDSRYHQLSSFSVDDAWPSRVFRSGGTLFYEAPVGSPGRVGNVHQNGRYLLEIVQPGPGRPVVTIRSTGWAVHAPDNRVTIEADVHKRLFTQNIFVTNVETLPDGREVSWITGDIVRGSLHTNGRLFISGRPIFEGPVTYSGAHPRLAAGSIPDFRAGPPQRTAELAFPPSNSQLKTQAQLNGYYFFGRTAIFLNGNQLVIRHRDESAVTRPLPPNGVIYVDGLIGPNKWGFDTGNAFVSGTLDGRLTIAAANDIFITGANPTIFASPPGIPVPPVPLEGGVRYANTNLTGANPSDDMLGLVADRWVRILHDDWPSATGRVRAADVAPHNITIHAAIFALEWAFEYERFSDPPVKGTITLVGSLTQRFRGAVGTFSGSPPRVVSGYLKNYNFDPRMAYDAPPHFLEPANSGWEITAWRTVATP